MANDTQMIKGILEGCILKIILKEELYGYKTVERLNEIGFEVNEATVYPILTRLENKGYLKIERRLSPLGPMRKYYFVTREGQAKLKEFQITWLWMMKMVNELMEVDDHDKQK